MNMSSSSRARGLLLLNALAWIRKQRWLQAIYRRFPQSLRSAASERMSAPVMANLLFPQTEAWARERNAPKTLQPFAGPRVDREPEVPGAVNLFGYMRGQFGLAESARLYTRALIEYGANVSVVDVDLGLPHAWEDRSLEPYLGHDAQHEICIVFVNPDYLDEAFDKIGRARLEGRYIIGCWFWELDVVPPEWVRHLAQVDELMVASKFVEDAFRKVTDKPILRVPLPVAFTGEEESSLVRADFGLPDDAFVFLCTFDFHSWLERKNPYAVLSAFNRAFNSDRDDVFLLIKTSNGHRHPAALLALLNATSGDRRIAVRDQIIDARHLRALQRCCDAYVSLHRAEGFGLGLAECMAIGKPVIATGWSGNLEFMDADNSCLVDFRLVPVLEGQYPHGAGALWAEADIASAAAHMAGLANSRSAAVELGERGSRAVREALDPRRASKRIMLRCAEISTQRATSRAAGTTHASLATGGRNDVVTARGGSQ